MICLAVVFTDYQICVSMSHRMHDWSVLATAVFRCSCTSCIDSVNKLTQQVKRPALIEALAHSHAHNQFFTVYQCDAVCVDLA